MGQLIFKFPFKTQYYEQDYYVSNNNFDAYKLIESWPTGLINGLIYLDLMVVEKHIYQTF